MKIKHGNKRYGKVTVVIGPAISKCRNLLRHLEYSRPASKAPLSLIDQGVPFCGSVTLWDTPERGSNTLPVKWNTIIVKLNVILVNVYSPGRFVLLIEKTALHRNGADLGYDLICG